MSRPERRLRILLVGPPTVHLERSQRVVEQLGHEVVVVPYADPLAGARAELPLVPAGRRAETLWKLWRARSQLREAVREVRPDLIHAHWLTGPGWIAALAGGAPVVVSAWGSDALRWTPQSRLAVVLARWTGRRAAAITYDADAVRAALVDAGIPGSRLVRLVFGVDTDRFHPGEADRALLSSLGVPANRPVVLAPRGLDPVYRPEVVVEAFARVATSRSATLLLRAGPAEQSRLDELLQRADELGVRDSVLPYASVDGDDLPALLRSVDVVVSVPESDGTSVVLLETLASGTPVVVSDLPANREWIPEGGAPLVPVGDSSALARALDHILTAPESAREEIAAAGRHVRESASADVERDTLRRLYESVTTG